MVSTSKMSMKLISAKCTGGSCECCRKFIAEVALNHAAWGMSKLSVGFWLRQKEKRRRISPPPPPSPNGQSNALDCLIALFFRSDSDRVFDRIDEHFAVADFAGLR